MTKSPNKGAYRRYIPHYDIAGLYQGITFRLADSLPHDVTQELLDIAKLKEDNNLRVKMETLLNNGHGSCWLRDPRVAEIVVGALKHFDGERYELTAWVVMPNHVHVLVRIFEGYPMDKVVQSWKTWTARNANKVLGRQGTFWNRGFFDRYIRDEHHFWNAVRYIHENPVKAGLVDDPLDWGFSSAQTFSVVP